MPEFQSGANSVHTSSLYATKGIMQFGEATAAFAIDEVGKKIGIPVVATAPVAAPTVTTGTVPMVFCSADSKLYAYVGSSWVASGAFA